MPRLIRRDAALESPRACPTVPWNHGEDSACRLLAVQDPTRAEQRGNRVVRESYGAAASRRNCRFIALTLAR